MPIRASAGIALDNNTALQKTTSVGIAMMDGTVPDMVSILVCSDRAMYRAKQNGRNRVELYQTADSAPAGK